MDRHAGTRPFATRAELPPTAVGSPQTLSSCAQSMHVSPTFEEFQAASADGKIVPVYRELFGDTLTTVEAYRRIARGNSSFLFESVVGGEKIGRYSFLGADPFLRIEAFGQNVVVTDAERCERTESRDPLRDLERLLARYQACHIPGLPRFCGGAVGYAGYDVIRYSERLPNAPED